MSTLAPHASVPHAPVPHGTRRGYLVGFALSALLTAIPFWLVMGGPPPDAGLAAAVIFAFALAQVVVHAVCFLHLDARSEGGWTLMAFVFTVVILGITVGGSIWVMFHLDTNMMPPMPAAMTVPGPAPGPAPAPAGGHAG